MKIINETPRKILRYLMFARKNNVALDTPILSKSKDSKVIKYFERHPDFTSWDDFDVKWDIGIENDPVIVVNRPEKWYLFDHKKRDIVSRPSDYWEKEAKRLNISTHALYYREAARRFITINDFFKLFFE